MGMGGWFMHSRTGLDTAYLGPDWMRAVETCIADAEKRGLEAWLYDEDRWPSGAAGGLATLDPKYRMRYLRCNILDSVDAPVVPQTESFVIAFIAKIDGINLHSYRPLPKGEVTLQPGEKILSFTVEPVQPHDFFNGSTYLNTIDPKAVAHFIGLTHERYKKSSRRHFGKTIPGIFTDEPHHGFVMCDTAKGWVYPLDSGWATPWSKDFPAWFEKRFGFDLRTRLPELFFRLKGEHFSPVKWQYMEALHSLFLKSFASQISQWCRANKLQMTGHVLAEDLPGSASVTNGSVLRFYELMQSPGIDILNLHDRTFWTAKQVSSTARQFGKKWVLSELYGCTGWQMPFAGHKEIGDWQAFLGINIRCHHLAWYSMAGESKRDFPASISFQSAWYKEYRAVEDYFSRVNFIMQQGRAACDILVLHPCESVWAQVYARWATWIKNQSPDIAPIDDNFKRICHWILAAQLDYDYGDEDQLARLAKIERVNGKPQLRLGLMSYRTILVGGLETMRSTTLDLLAKFQRAGGKVIFAGKAPGYVNALRSAAPAQLSAKSIRVPLQRVPLVKALRAAAPPIVEIEGITSTDETCPVILQVRRDGAALTIAILNTDPKRAFSNFRIKFNGKGAQVQEWDCRIGTVYHQPHRVARKSLSWTTSLAPLGERVFRVVAKVDSKLQPRPAALTSKSRKVTGPFAYKLDEPNALPIDRYEWRIGKNRWKEVTDILVIDTQVRDQLGLKHRSLGMMQPWARKKSGKPVTTPIQLRTSFDIRALPSGTTHLVMEQPAQWSVKLNGKSIATKRDAGWFIDPCFRKIPLPAAALKKGRNVLEFSATFSEAIDLEAIYLLGDFGVYCADTVTPVLDRLPAKLKVGDVCAQGLPFYSGRIRYTIPIDANARRLRLPSFGGAVATVKNDAAKTIGFPPYETELELTAAQKSLELDVILTRRNIFGPLHRVPKEQFHYGPATFRSTAAEYQVKGQAETYSAVPQLYPAGLLAAPELQS